MTVVILLFAALIRNVAPFNVESPASLSCEVGDVIQNGRITCTCTQKQVYECIYKKTLNNHPDAHLHRHYTCQPNKIYVEDTTTCICNYNGTWPHSTCGDVFNSLPAKNVLKAKCHPNGYVFIGCNVCRCDSKGYIDKSRCTQNDCQESVKSPERRRSSKATQVFGNCEINNWYSLAPCQFCFCLNENKLVCNTGKYDMNKLQLGTYSLFVCGKDLIKEAIELIPNDYKMLRHGDKMRNFTENSKHSIPRPSFVNNEENNRLEKDVTQEDPNLSQPTVVNNDGNNKSEKDVTQEDSNSQETEGNENNFNRKDTVPTRSVEEKVEYEVNNQEGSRVGRTELPYEEEDQTSESREEEERKASLEIKDEGEDGSNNNEIVDPGLQIPSTATKDSEQQDSDITLQNLEDIGRQLKDNLPMMLDKVFQMALRKSMVTIAKDSNCVPGSVNTVKCNTCFCLKNSKLLCTNNPCK